MSATGLSVDRNGSNGHADISSLRLVGTFEAALILGVERSRLARWLSENREGKNSIAEPIRLQCGPVWTREQIDEKLRELFMEEHGSDPNEEELRKWARARSLRRWKALTPKLPKKRFEQIIA